MTDATPLTWRDRAGPLAVCLAVRLVFLWAALGRSFTGDEGAYVRLARAWAEHGAYGGQWPPLHSASLAGPFFVFGDAGEDAARVALTLGSLWVAWWLMALAHATYGRRAALVAGWLFAVHLPLVPFSHLLLSEQLFLALVLPAWTLLQRGPTPGRVVVAGALLGLAALTRESGVLLVVALAAWLAWRGRAEGRRALAPAAALALTAGLVVAPWTARNLHAYDRFVPLAVTAGTNAYQGWNGRYVNFDLAGLRAPQDAYPGAGLRDALLADAPPQWDPAYLPNHAERDAHHLARGAAFAAEHPGYWLRTRVVKLSDFVTPLSYAVKHARLDEYGAPLDGIGVRRAVAWLSVLLWPLVGALALAGWAAAPSAPGARGLAVAVAAGVGASALVVAMSRFRVPLEALALVHAAGFLVARPRELARPRIVAAGACGAALLLLWFVALPPTLASLASIG